MAPRLKKRRSEPRFTRSFRELEKASDEFGQLALMSEEQTTSKNGTTALASLLNQLNLPTLALILITGGGNWFATKATSDEQRADILKAVSQIHDLHESLDEFEQRQKETLIKATTALDNQNQLLRNQSMMISNQQQLISQLKFKP